MICTYRNRPDTRTYLTENFTNDSANHVTKHYNFMRSREILVSGHRLIRDLSTCTQLTVRGFLYCG